MRGPVKRIAVFVLALMWLGPMADDGSAQLTMQFPVERDAGLDSWDNHDGYGGIFDPALETEEWNNSGAAPNVRGKKFTQHSAIMDWDTDAINQWITDNTNPGDILSWTFNVYPVSGPIDDVQIETIESLNDWAEGDGPQMFDNFNWSQDTPAVTQNFAQTYWTLDGADIVLDEDRSLPWIDNDTGTGGIDDNQYSVLTQGSNFSPGDPIPDYINSEDLSAVDLDFAAVDYTYASVPLDDELIDAILNDPDNRGIVFGPINDGSVNAGTNWEFFTRESNGFQGETSPDLPGPVAPFLEVTVTPGLGPALQAGDADQNLQFDQLDLVQVQQAAKYLSGTAATWGEGDWDGAPGGIPGSPPAGNGFFDQLDIVSALAAGLYLQGPYAAISGGGQEGDDQTSITYDPATGAIGVDAPAGTELTSINIDSAAGVFTGDAAQNLGGSFDNDADNNIFKATFGSSFGSLSFGNVAQPGLAEDFVLNDLTVVGSLAGGGDLGNVDLIYIPEPASMLLLGLGLLGLAGSVRRGCRRRP